MQKSKNKTGSVLMEFIVVLPIYMLLLGFAFVIGDMSLTTIHLAGSGDRTQAFSSKDYDLERPFERFIRFASPDKDGRTEFSYDGDSDMGSSVSVSDYKPESSVYVADATINGPWVEMTAGNVVDSYTLPPWTRGIVAYWYCQNYDTTDGTTQVGGPVNEMLASGGTHRTDVKGKDLSARGGDERKFGFYTLRRLVRRDKDKWSVNPRLTYRTWGDGQLVKNNVWKKVADPESVSSAERFPDEDNASSYAGVDGEERIGKAPPTWEYEDVTWESAHYHDRDEDLKKYSNLIGTTMLSEGNVKSYVDSLSGGSH